MDELVPPSDRQPGARVLQGLQVLSLRSLAGDTDAAPALQAAGVPGAMQPGSWAGHDPIVVGCSPRERLVLGQGDDARRAMRALQQSLAPGRQALAMALDLSEAVVVVELRGPALDDWLSQLVDASAIPRTAGSASACRLVDVRVLLLRLAPERLWLACERPLLPYLRDWLLHTHAGAFAAARAGCCR